MHRKLIQILFLVFSTSIYAQNFIFKGEIGSFKSASAFSVTPSGFFYISDIGNNEVVKLDTLDKVIQKIGGYGWDNSAFDNPADVFATDLRVYVTDKNNHRIQVFDKDLNFLFLIKTDLESNEFEGFRYPTSCATSIQNDIFILDSENTRILKYNSSGNFNLEFGNYRSGDFTLENPSSIALSHNSKIFVLDSGFLSVFDQYGMGLLKIHSKNETQNINITFNNLILNSSDSLYYQNLNNPLSNFRNITPSKIPTDESIIEAILFSGKLYILTEKRILIFSIL
ncbi:MAG: NHL repeat-containing protein [Bacteroidetes bacterium]|nr:NHL repeat-containing protein [Bacteroidota bacterium]MBU1115396.1 NHL repeat-containing protein [Bacteroidota bacterium]MBU1797917.1 NHL repeat-containing protein [Bacteroidota bacterium]